MRVILINPPLDSVLAREKVNPVTAFLFYNSAPLGILYIAAVLERAGHTVSALDAAAEQLNVPEAVARVKLFQPDLIGITSTTVGFEGARRLAQGLKDEIPEVPVLLGGPHVSLLPEEAMTEASFDLGAIGEGEFTTLEVLEVLAGQRSLASVNGLVYREGDAWPRKINGTNPFKVRRPTEAISFIRTAPRANTTDMDSLPFPSRHLVSPDRYIPVPIDQHGMPKFTIISSRGCPHSCAFCQKANSGYRSFSTEYIVDEMEHLVRDFGAKDIAFVDSLFAHSKRRVEDICDEIIRRGLKVSWTCSSRVECVDKPLLQKMRQAGCWRTRFGIESGNNDVLSFISKGINKEQINNAITWANEVGLRPKAFFIVGHMPDTKETIEETIEFAKSIPLHDVTVQINTILPKTPQEEIWKKDGGKYGKIIDETFDDKNFWQPTFTPHGLSGDDLIYYHRKFYREFYFRPVTLWRHLSALRGLDDVRKYAQAAGLFAFLFFDRRLPEFSDAQAHTEP